MFKGNLQEVRWAYLGRPGDDSYHLQSAEASSVPGVFFSRDMPQDERDRVLYATLDRCARMGCSDEPDGEASIVWHVSKDGRAVAISTVSSFSTSGVFSLDELDGDFDEFIIAAGEVVKQ